MITYTLDRKRRILIVQPEGKLEAQDFTRLASEVDPFIAESGALAGLLIEAEAFPGWKDFAALVSHLRFVKNHHAKIAKVAAVTDSGFLAILPTVADHFLAAEIKHFPYQEKQAALNWLQTP